MRGDDRERLTNGAPMCCCCMADTELADGERSVEAVSNAGRTVHVCVLLCVHVG